MEIFSFSAVFEAFHYHSHNETYAIPGTYDITSADATWVLAASLGIFTMTTGLALLEVGTVSAKHRVNCMMKNVADFCVGGFCYWAIAFGLMYGRGQLTNGLFGAGDFFLAPSVDDPLLPQILTFFFFQISFATTSASIFSGAIAERCKFNSYIILTFMLMIVYGIGGGWIWGQHGWLKNIGVIEFSGAGPCHIIGGAAGFVGAWWIGPRIGRFDRSTEPLPMSDGVITVTGLFTVWWGWLAFNSGSSYGITGDRWAMAARAGTSTLFASISSGFVAIIFSMIKHKGKVSVLEVVSGCVTGLVAINSGCYMFSMTSAGLTGAIAAILCLVAGPIIEKAKIDDACGSTAIHLVGGIWGQLSVGFFADAPTGFKGIFIGGGPNLLIAQAISAVSVTIWAGVAMLLILWLVNNILPIRLSREEELLGADLTEHYLGPHYVADQNKIDTDLEKPMSKLDKIINITTPIAKRFNAPVDEINQRDFDCYNRNKQFHTNQAFVQGDERY